jgi:hypothetical protein
MTLTLLEITVSLSARSTCDSTYTHARLANIIAILKLDSKTLTFASVETETAHNTLSFLTRPDHDL